MSYQTERAHLPFGIAVSLMKTLNCTPPPPALLLIYMMIARRKDHMLVPLVLSSTFWMTKLRSI